MTAVFIDHAPAAGDRLAHLPLRLRAPFLRRKEASEYLDLAHGVSCAPATLAKLAVFGGGPVYRKTGARTVIYAREDLDAWALARLGAPRRSTSDAEAGR